MEFFKPPVFDDGETDVNSEAVKVSPGPSLDSSLDKAEEFELNQFAPPVKKKKVTDYSEFSSTQFNKVETLLTNVEDYSKKIRDDVERYKKRSNEEVDLLKSEVELELAEALIKKKEAEDQALEIVKNAEDSQQEIIEAGKQEGYEAGYAEGMQQLQAENEQNVAQVTALLQELQELQKDALRNHEKYIVQLGSLIAKKVVHNEIKTEKELVVNMVKEVIGSFDGLGNIKISVNPAEYDFLLRYQPELKKYVEDDQTIKIKPDASIKTSYPVIESDYSAMDLNLEKQFSEIDIELNSCMSERKRLFRSES